MLRFLALMLCVVVGAYAKPGILGSSLSIAAAPASVEIVRTAPAIALGSTIGAPLTLGSGLVSNGLITNGLISNGLVSNGLISSGLLSGGLVAGGVVSGGLVTGGGIINGGLLSNAKLLSKGLI